MYSGNAELAKPEFWCAPIRAMLSPIQTYSHFITFWVVAAFCCLNVYYVTQCVPIGLPQHDHHHHHHHQRCFTSFSRMLHFSGDRSSIHFRLYIYIASLVKVGEWLGAVITVPFPVGFKSVKLTNAYDFPPTTIVTEPSPWMDRLYSTHHMVMRSIVQTTHNGPNNNNNCEPKRTIWVQGLDDNQKSNWIFSHFFFFNVKLSNNWQFKTTIQWGQIPLQNWDGNSWFSPSISGVTIFEWWIIN